MAEEKPKSVASLRENPCPICSGMRFTWGITVGKAPANGYTLGLMDWDGAKAKR